MKWLEDMVFCRTQSSVVICTFVRAIDCDLSRQNRVAARLSFTFSPFGMARGEPALVIASRASMPAAVVALDSICGIILVFWNVHNDPIVFVRAVYPKPTAVFFS